MASGAVGEGSASGEASGSGMLSGGLPALDPGARVEDARGRLIGRVQSVRRNAEGQVESVAVAVGRRTATLPAGNFSADGNVLVSAMGKGAVEKAGE
jgi:hypothetical protein